ncbi:MAG: hypothetical protein HYV60_11740 [Planctomycetia bacterium]|nr:hypothetical protein [Planctomycetia bacterium]
MNWILTPFGLLWSPWIDFATGIDEVVAWVETNWDVLRSEPWEYQHKA